MDGEWRKRRQWSWWWKRLRYGLGVAAFLAMVWVCVFWLHACDPRRPIGDISQPGGR